ncbi:MAG: VOC family protein [Anaerolineae bacterium]|nr:VOC family protein [Anaerolineae bacterium]
MTLPATTSISDVQLQVRDLTRALAFYSDTLGFQVLRTEGQSAWLSATGTPPYQIQLTALPGALPKPRHTSGLYHVAIRLPDRAALARTFYRLVALGVPFEGFADHLVSEALYLPDLDGNGLELYRDRPRESWPMANGQIAMSNAQLDVEALLKEGEHPIDTWQGIAPGTDIGHIHLHVGDLKRAEDFYVDLLGMDVMQRSFPGALFVAAGGYHHHIGLNIWAGRNVPPAPDNAVGLRHFSIEIPTEDSLREIADKIESAGKVISPLDEDGLDGISVRDGDSIEVRLVHHHATPEA